MEESSTLHHHPPLPQVTYRELLAVLFDRMDPTTLNRQGNDRGTQYRSGIYYHSEDQKVGFIALGF